MSNDRTSYQYTFNDDNNIIGVSDNNFHYHFNKMDFNITVTIEGAKATYYQNSKEEKRNKTEKED